MRSLLRVPAAALLLFSLCGIRANAQTVLTFENLAGQGSRGISDTSIIDYGTTITQDGFTLTAPGLSSWADAGFYGDYTGSIALFGNAGPVVISPTVGSPFNLLSLDLANEFEQVYPYYYNNVPSVTITGTLFAGGTVTKTVSMLATDSLQLVTFDSTWSSLASVSLPGFVQIDNVEVDVHTSTPEPGTFGLLVASGVAGIGMLKRRRSRKV